MQGDILQQLRGTVVCRSLEETSAVARAFLGVLGREGAVALSGDLGTGKTAFVKELAKHLGIRQTVKSPSFNVCCIYDIPDGGRLVHIDAYRFTDPSQYESLLVDEIAPEPRIVCVEWPELAEGYFKPVYWLDFDIRGEAHTITLR